MKNNFLDIFVKILVASICISIVGMFVCAAFNLSALPYFGYAFVITALIGFCGGCITIILNDKL